MKWVVQYIMRWYEKKKLYQKLMVGYVFIVLIPVAALSLLLFRFNERSLRNAYESMQQQKITAAAGQLESSLTQISNYNFFFRGNTQMRDYLTGQQNTVSEVLFNYFGSMSSTFSCAAYDNRVQQLTVFGLREYPLIINGRLMALDNIKNGETYFNTARKVVNGGYWYAGSNGELYCYSVLRDTDTRIEYGMLRITADLGNIMKTNNSFENETVYMYFPESDILYEYSDAGLINVDNRDDTEYSSFLSAEVGNGFCVLFKSFVPVEIEQYGAPVYFLVGVLSLIVFSLIYFLISKSITARLIDFNSFIKKQSAENLMVYEREAGSDEIGSVINEYNGLIKRTNNLIHDNYEVSLKMKEAMYYSLQAQIKPHFLYNILENIRMSSESHNDRETADMTFVFSRYMRYATNNSTGPEPLEEALGSARDYLSVYKIRHGDMLEYEFSVETEIDDVYCPRFIFQTFLENSLGHGMIIGVPIRITISVYDDGDKEVCISIADNGKGIEKEMLELIRDILYEEVTRPSSRHVGLRNANDRLKANHPDRKGIEIDSELNKGTIIRFRLKRGVADENTGGRG